MALLETVTSWKEGVDAFTQKDYGGSLQSFSEIPDPSARILFNIACVLLKLNRREEALKVHLLYMIENLPFVPSTKKFNLTENA